MKKGALLILVYTMVVVALVVSVKVAKTYASHKTASHEAMVASCDDPPPTDLPGE